MKQATLIFAMALLAATACSKKDTDAEGAGTTRTTSGQPASEQGDNTRMNQRDRSGSAPMDPANGSDADREMTAQIRRAVVGDRKLSQAAKNVKIVTVGGVVTLRGPVRSVEEKNEIADKARQAAGVRSVDNELEVIVE